jgi:hypothetical protein
VVGAFMVPIVNTTTAGIYSVAGAGVSNTNLSTLTISFCVTYPAS